jgi:hypothetical protein
MARGPDHGNRLKLFRDVANITMDTNDVETVDFNALGGADLVTVNDLSGTDVTRVDADLGAPDGQADRVLVNGTAGNDAINASGAPAMVNVTGLAATVSPTAWSSTPPTATTRSTSTGTRRK